MQIYINNMMHIIIKNHLLDYQNIEITHLIKIYDFIIKIMEINQEI